jgi:hypothetical protein
MGPTVQDGEPALALALEAEVTEFLGRERYQRAAACEDARLGSRNGYREVTVKTTVGPVGLARQATPQKQSERRRNLTREAEPRPPIYTGFRTPPSISEGA